MKFYSTYQIRYSVNLLPNACNKQDWPIQSLDPKDYRAHSAIIETHFVIKIEWLKFNGGILMVWGYFCLALVHSKARMYVQKTSLYKKQSQINNEDQNLEIGVESFEVTFVLTLVHFNARRWSRTLGFNPRSSHTKDFKNGTWYLLA